MKKCIVLFATMMLLGSIAFAANPVTVGPTGDFTTLQPAIESWAVGGANEGETPPFVINVDPAAVIDETVCLDDGVANGDIVGNLVIQSSTPGTLPVVKIQQDLGSGGDGIRIHQSRFNITLIDLLFCPSQTNMFTDDMIKIDENGSTTPSTVNSHLFENCVFTDIVASGDPAVTSKADVLAKNFPADIDSFVSGSAMLGNLLQVWGDTGEHVDVTIDNCTFYKPVQASPVYLRTAGGTDETITVDDCLIVGPRGTGGEWDAALYLRPYPSGNVIVTGTQPPRVGDLTKCTAVFYGTWHSLYVAGTSGDSTAVVNNTMCFQEDINATAKARSYSGGSEDDTVTDCIFVNLGVNCDAAIVNYPVDKDTFTRCTFHCESGDTIYSGSADPGYMEFVDCVWSGNALAYDDVNTSGDVMYNSCIATSGPDAMTTFGIAMELIDCVEADPQYVSKAPLAPGLMDTTNAALFMKASDAASIGGGAKYTVPDAGDNLQNAFKSIGDCEADFVIDSSDRSGTPTDITMLDDQNQVSGVIGNATEFTRQSGSRFEGNSANIPVAFDGSDQTFSMYFKIPGPPASSYPRISLKRNQTVTPPQELGGHDEAILWTNAELNAIDGGTGMNNMWHQFTPDVSTMTWDGDDTVSIFIHTYYPLGPEINLDEIVYDDPTVDTRVEDWGLF